MKSEQEIRALLREWILKRAKRLGTEAGQTLLDETPLLEKRVLSSLQVMDLILYIEQIGGCGINPDNLKPGSFKDLNAIYSTFFAGARS